MDPTLHFIWILSDATPAKGAYMDGGFEFNFQSNKSKNFANYYKNLTPANYPQSPWIKVIFIFIKPDTTLQQRPLASDGYQPALSEFLFQCK